MGTPVQATPEQVAEIIALVEENARLIRTVTSNLNELTESTRRAAEAMAREVALATVAPIVRAALDTTLTPEQREARVKAALTEWAPSQTPPAVAPVTSGWIREVTEYIGSSTGWPPRYGRWHLDSGIVEGEPGQREKRVIPRCSRASRISMTVGEPRGCVRYVIEEGEPAEGEDVCRRCTEIAVGKRKPAH